MIPYDEYNRQRAKVAQGCIIFAFMMVAMGFVSFTALLGLLMGPAG